MRYKYHGRTLVSLLANLILSALEGFGCGVEGALGGVTGGVGCVPEQRVSERRDDEKVFAIRTYFTASISIDECDLSVRWFGSCFVVLIVIRGSVGMFLML